MLKINDVENSPVNMDCVLIAEDFDWEEQTEKFAEVLGSHHSGDLHNDSGFNTAEKSYRTQEVGSFSIRQNISGNPSSLWL